ncbi:hypothetical protein M0D45_21855 [Xanthomonas prunicola]|uniref:hypothetical protein n=1 Tax=Xanthomonas prunicola TaxID=2053930 RepID=UPI0021B4520E|nr:hypothetical protein [Xanthomonas prunicola]UXA53203.1 hypothetical protein M0D45_21855 [Xanthomonas prunicola]
MLHAAAQGEPRNQGAANPAGAMDGSVARVKFFPAIDAGHLQGCRNFALALDALHSKLLWMFECTPGSAGRQLTEKVQSIARGRAR